MQLVADTPSSPAAERAAPPVLLFDEPAIAILERMGEGFYAIDTEWRILYVNRSAERFWGRGREELLGRSMLALFPKFAGSEAHLAHQRAMTNGEHVRAAVTSTATGAPVELSLYPDAAGLSVYFSDATRRRQLESTLHERDQSLTLAELSAGIGIWDADLATDTLRGTPQFFRLLGLPPPTEPLPMSVSRDLRHPDDRERVVRGFKEALAAGSDLYEAEYRIIRADGETRWIFGRGRVIRDADGKPVRYSGIDIDITERKRQEDQIRVVMRELLHRTNNLLAVIQAMVHQTARTSSSLKDFEQRFGARIRGLAHSNALLVGRDWRGGLVQDLVRTQLAPFVEADGRRLVLAGPAVVLKPQAVQNIGLALHELATNASKYGALSVPEGKIAITWDLRDDGNAATGLRLMWRESGGPPVRQPRRTGFGRFVVESMIKSALDAEVSTDFNAAGVGWTVDIPAEHFLREDSDKP